MKIAACVMALCAAVSIAGCSSSGSSGKAASGEVKETMRPYSVRQVVAADNEHGRTIMWQMTNGKEDSLEYRKAGSNDIRSVKAVSKELKGDKGVSDSFVYTARLDNLEKGTDYEYRTRQGNEVSKWYPLATDNGGKVKAIVTSDSQSSDYSDWEKLFKDAASRNPDAAFFIDLGDIVDNGQDEYQWQAWFKTVADTIDKIPVAPAVGNHEAYSLDWKETMPERYLTHFSLPKNGDDKLANHYYSFDWGDVHFTVLDTSLVEEKQWVPDLFEKEKVWAEKDITSSKKKWKVVLMHKDPLQYSFADPSRPAREEGFSDEGKEFMPIFDKTGVDLVLSAHLHTYRDRGHIYDFKRADHGPVYVILGLGGNVRYPGLWKRHALDEYVALQPETDNYNVFEADDNQLVLSGYLPDGTLLHQTIVRKD